MRQETSMLNKMLAFMLCLCVMVSSMNLSLITYAAGEITDTATVTVAELVADNYESLTSGEKAILKSGLLTSQTYTYPIPASSEGLVTVDADTRTITVADYDKDGFVWRPVSAAVVYSGGSETVEITDGEGSFTYDGNSYTVEVLYELRTAVDPAAQAKLLNGPYYLIKGVNNLDDFDSFYATFDTVGTNISGLKSLADGIRLSTGAVIKLSNQTTIDAVNRLYAQSTSNGGPIDITILIENYEDSASKTVYLLTSGSAFKTTAVNTYEDIKAITEDKGIPTLMEAIKSKEPATYRKINLALNAMKALVAGTQDAAEDEWGILDPANNALKSGMTDEDYAEIDRLIAEAGAAEYHDDDIKTSLFVDSKKLSANVNQHDVTVIVSAEVIKETSFDNATPTSLEDHTAVFQLSDGTSAADILAAIAECGVEEAALAAWGEISEDNYVRTADEITGTLVTDLTYKIKYSPKMLEIEYDFDTDLPETVPYGYNMTLPVHEGEDLVYDYTVNGKAYLQGEIVRITEASQINRTEGKPWNVQTINKLVALNFAADLNAAQIAVLNSVALRSDYILLREPDNNDGLVGVMVLPDSGEGTDNTEQTFKYMVMAQNYASGLRGLSWKAVSGKAILGTDEITAEFVFNDGVAAFTSVQFDRVEVEYRIVLEGVVTEQQIIDAYNLPHLLATEAAEQKRNLELLNNQYILL